jgi:excisionase family DNA binding protein
MDDSKLGMDFFTYEEAAEALKVTTRTIKNYIKKGYLTRIKVQGLSRVTKESVQRKKLESGIEGPAFNRFTMTAHDLSIKQLQERLALIEFILGIKDTRLNLNKVTASGLYNAAKGMIAKKHWEFSEIEYWCKIYAGLNEEDLTVISEVAVTSRPWDALYSLFKVQLAYLSKTEFVGSDEARRLRDRLLVCEQKMNGSVLFWIANREGHVIDVPQGQTVQSFLKELGFGYQAQNALKRVLSSNS